MAGLTYFSLFKLCSAASALLSSRTVQKRTIQHRAFRLLSGLGVGAIAAFLVGRYWARGWISKTIAGDDKFAAIASAVAHEGFKKASE
jgi:uncharacterized protein YfiM (DUF2279 family)